MSELRMTVDVLRVDEKARTRRKEASSPSGWLLPNSGVADLPPEHDDFPLRQAGGTDLIGFAFIVLL
ncbi:hypothetical protein JTE90_014045 [Oedothorax gibbosus]|uniref:Uncharacterized protein n=1 Tax=Oedothorax gibbosus TaxID=931172 RepID=A0AAV6V3M5_9ARAC|nr:hypothetical protein JTE90_014045 [Oedothorax gibbosus]